MRRILPFIVLVCALSAALGWMRAGTSAGQQAPTIDGWNTLQYNSLSKQEYGTIAAQLKASSLLPLSLIEERKGPSPEASAVKTPGALPDFPKIGGAKTVRNIRYVSLIVADNIIQTVKAGAVLESGWEIKSISRKSVVAVFDGQELEIPINSYLQEAFEKPAEGVMDSAGDDASKTNNAVQRRAGGGE